MKSILKHIYRQAVVEGNTGAGATVDATAANSAVTAAEGTATPTAPILTPEQIKEQEAAKEVRRIEIKAKFNNLVDVSEKSFHFRKVTNEIKDEATGAVSKIVTKRPTVVIPVPVPSFEGVVDILEKGDQKQLELLMEAVAGVVLEQAREYINDHEGVNEANFPYDILSWEKIANLPKAERRGGGISKEVWDDFEKDYIEVMPGVTGKTLEAVTMAAKVFKTKFAGATTNKPVLKLLQGQLAMYTSATTQGEQFAPCIEFLGDKLEKLINTDETNLLAAL